MVNAIEIELHGSDRLRDQPHDSRNWRHKWGWWCSIVRRSHHVRLSILAAFVVLNLCIFASSFSKYTLPTCGVFRALSSYNNCPSNPCLVTITTQEFEQRLTAAYSKGYRNATRKANQDQDLKDAINDANLGQHLNPTYAGQQIYVGVPECHPQFRHNFVTHDQNSQNVGPDLASFSNPQLTSSTSIPSFTQNGFSASVVVPGNGGGRYPAIFCPPQKECGGFGHLPKHADLTLKAYASALCGARVAVAPEVKKKIKSDYVVFNKGECNKVKFEYFHAFYRGEMQNGVFKSLEAQEGIGALYRREGGLEVFRSYERGLKGLVECALFWTHDQERQCKSLVCAWKCTKVEDKNSRGFPDFTFSSAEILGGSQIVKCESKGVNCATLVLEVKGDDKLTLLGGHHGDVTLPAQAVCSWSEAAQHYICYHRAFPVCSEDNDGRRDLKKRVLVNIIIGEDGRLCAQPLEHEGFEYGEHVGYVQQLPGFARPSICVFEHCFKNPGLQNDVAVAVHVRVVSEGHKKRRTIVTRSNSTKFPQELLEA